MPFLPGAVNYKSSYSINLPLYRKLRTTVSCYTSTDHHHLLMHTICTPVYGVSNGARTSSFSAGFPIANLPLTHRLFALHTKVPSFRTVITIITSARGHHTRESIIIGARAQNGYFGFNCGITDSSVFVFFTQPQQQITEVSFFRWTWSSCRWCARGDRGRGATDVSNECVLMMIDWVLRALLGYVNSLA